MNKYPICPYCKSDDCIIEQPHWNNNKTGIWTIICYCFCIACGKNFEVIGEIKFHNSRKVKQDNQGYPY